MQVFLLLFLFSDILIYFKETSILYIAYIRDNMRYMCMYIYPTFEVANMLLFSIECELPKLQIISPWSFMIETICAIELFSLSVKSETWRGTLSMFRSKWRLMFSMPLGSCAFLNFQTKYE